MKRHDCCVICARRCALACRHVRRIKGTLKLLESHINLSVGPDIFPPPRWRIKDHRKVVSEIYHFCSANEKPLTRGDLDLLAASTCRLTLAEQKRRRVCVVLLTHEKKSQIREMKELLFRRPQTSLMSFPCNILY